jgi:hypothetical protein
VPHSGQYLNDGDNSFLQVPQFMVLKYAIEVEF